MSPARVRRIADKHGARLLAAPAVLVSLLLGLAPRTAQAQAPVLIDASLTRKSLGVHLEFFEDPSAQLTIEQISNDGVAFNPVSDPVPSFGFSSSAVWLRFTADNTGAGEQEWLLEFAYPHVDHVDLYVPAPEGGFDKRASGDHHPFRDREVAYRNVIFRLKQPPGPRVYYLRAQTSGSLTLPLVAWSPKAFLGHLNVQQPVLWMFYGLIVAISLYNLFIFFSVREIAYFYYVAYTASYGLFQFILNGLAFQYLWPDAIWWANQCMPTSIGLGFLAGAQFHRHFLNIKAYLPVLDRVVRMAGVYGGLFAVFGSLLVPYETGIRVVVMMGTIMILLGMGSAVWLALRRNRAAYFYLMAWAVFLVGILLYLLKTMNVLPSNFATDWSIQVGASIEVVLLSLGLADRINVMRRDLQRLNNALTQNVTDLQDALQRAEDARRAKSEFLASVSHELRTPLNSIINIPEGLLEDFAIVDSATCHHCKARFELEEADQIDGSTVCPECHEHGKLARDKRHMYRGVPEQTAEYLGHIVRSGSHLLEVVNDILDISRLEAGQMSLTMEAVDLHDLFERVASSLSGLADHKGVVLEMAPLPEACVVPGDAVKLRQVLINLVGNAIKFSDGRGTVRVCAKKERGAFVLSVEDHGIGIAKDDQVRIFQSFVQAEGGRKRHFGGSGLGLAITKQLVELHAGQIWVDSEIGRGSTFYVRLPSMPRRPSSPFPMRAAPTTEQPRECSA